MQSTSVISVSPSFTAHSSNNNLADIAARVVQEFRNENGHNDIYDDLIDDDDQPPNNNHHHFYNPPPDDLKSNENDLKSNENDEDEGEFEFAVVPTQSPYSYSPVSADEIFSNGEILPRYPLFDRSLLLDDNEQAPDFFHKNSVKSDSSFSISNSNSKPVRVPLRKLFSDEQRDYSPSSCSSSSSDDLDGITPGTYCIWKPKEDEDEEVSPERCKKSNSTGNTSKRWKFRNLLLHRSNSDNHISAAGNGKDAASVVVVAKKRSEKVKKVEKTSKVAVAADDDGDTTAMMMTKPVTVESIPAKKSNKGGNRLRSYLPYKQDLVGVFANVNGLSRNLHPF